VRLLVLVLVLAAAYGVVRVGERRRGRGVVKLAPGLVLVTAPGCALCPSALRALQSAGGDPRVIEAADMPPSAGRVTSVPVAMVIGTAGEVLLRRSGRSVITDARELTAGLVGSA